MHFNRRIAKIRAALIFPVGLLSVGAVAADQPPQLVANPYFVAVATPPATQVAAANASAAISKTPSQQVVYPAATTAAWPSQTTPRGLPRNRAAALGAAVRVATLSEAFRAGVPASGGANLDGGHDASAVAEPARFIPPASAHRIPGESIATSAYAAPMSAGSRYDPEFQPVVWLSDAHAPAASAPMRNRQSPAAGYSQTDSSQVGNPLRREYINQPASPDQAGRGDAAGNPLR